MEVEEVSNIVENPAGDADECSVAPQKLPMKFSINSNTNLIAKRDTKSNSDETSSDKLKTGDDGFKKPILIGPRKPKKGNALVKPMGAPLSKPSEPVLNSNNKKPINEEPLSLSKSELDGIVSEAVEKNVRAAQEKPRVEKKPAPPPPPPCTYQEPPWKGIPDEDYSLEEVKGGLVERDISLSGRSMSLVGRLDPSDITLAHPSVSRYHAVLQYRATRHGIYDKGFYLYDLGSTHGTFLNRHRIKPNTYVRIQVGHMVKFGGSSRFFVLKGPEADEEPESEFTVTELKEMRRTELEERQMKKEQEEEEKAQEEERQRREAEARGVDWGMREDADEESDLSENPYAVTTNEELYSDDPKKELKKWMEREGEELHFEVEQAERGKIVCRVTLPLDNERGGDVVIESTGRSKKEATTSCALEACRYIDRQGMFRQSNQESRKRQVRNWEENDYYDSDEDNFYDRTGQIDQKRQKRMEKAGVVKNEVQSYESLVEKHGETLKVLEVAERKLAEVQKAMEVGTNHTDGLDDLDAYMLTLEKSVPSKKQLRAAQEEVDKLRKEEQWLVSLMKLARPASMPDLAPARARVDRIPDLPKPDQPRPDESMPDLPKPDQPHASLHSSSQSPPLPSRPAILGPVMPSSEEMKEFEKKKRSRTRNRQRPAPKSETFMEDDFNSVTWKPPEGQTGDGRTSLNDKLGY